MCPLSSSVLRSNFSLGSTFAIEALLLGSVNIVGVQANVPPERFVGTYEVHFLNSAVCIPNDILVLNELNHGEPVVM